MMLKEVKFFVNPVQLPHTEFECQAYILKKEEGGRHTPFFTKYRPQFYFRTTDVTGEVTLPSGTEMVMPGDDGKFSVKLITPIAMSENLNFAIREVEKQLSWSSNKNYKINA